LDGDGELQPMYLRLSRGILLCRGNKASKLGIGVRMKAHGLLAWQAILRHPHLSHITSLIHDLITSVNKNNSISVKVYHHKTPQAIKLVRFVKSLSRLLAFNALNVYRINCFT
jgi:hypothetical protein